MIADNREGGERAIAAPGRFRAPGSRPGAIVAPAIKLCLLVVVNGDDDCMPLSPSFFGLSVRFFL